MDSKPRPLHSYIKPTILSFPRRRESSIINSFLDTGLRDCVTIANNIITYPPLAEVSRSDGGGYCRDCSPESEAARLGNAPYFTNYPSRNTLHGVVSKSGMTNSGAVQRSQSELVLI